ncbi:hypothetical protein [Streptomyces sp. KR55]|uniref:hypothetical protein n=1 Tax=Streptomyces sp. KR55 TaxID=3457425 RepID=UPI003FD35DC6
MGSRRLNGMARLPCSAICLRGSVACVIQVVSHLASQFGHGVEPVGQFGRAW